MKAYIGNGGQVKEVLALQLAEVRCLEQLLEQNDLGALGSSLINL